MKAKCPACANEISLTVRGHERGRKNFRQLTRLQQRAAIAKTTRDLKEMREIYRGLR